MALGRQRDRQSEMLASWSEMPHSPGHAFYDRLQAERVAAGFDGFVEGLCATHYAARRGRLSLPPGRYFRMLLVGYFEGIDSERGLEWRRRLQSRPDHAPADRRRDTQGVPGQPLRLPRRHHHAERLPDAPADRRRRPSDRRHRRQLQAKPLKLKHDFINGLIGLSRKRAQTASPQRPSMCLMRCSPTMRRVGSPGRPTPSR
jgi:hypothetical protein